MDPVFDRNGKTVGWLYNDVVYDMRHPRAFILDTSVYSYDHSIYLGFFENGFFRHRSGGAVAFVEGARGNPRPPTPEILRHDPPDPQPSPRKSPKFRGLQPGSSPDWSGMTWEQFLSDQ
jgi:hypothetical protein